MKNSPKNKFNKSIKQNLHKFAQEKHMMNAHGVAYSTYSYIRIGTRKLEMDEWKKKNETVILLVYTRFLSNVEPLYR